MDMTGEFRIPAPRQKVWEALNDPEVLKQSIPGCDEIQKLSDTELAAKVTAKVGPVKARFGGKVVLSDLDPPNGYKITGEGSGGAAGFAKGGATVRLADDGADATLLTYTVEAHVGGKLAQIGSRLIDATARKMAEEFFTRFSDAVGGAGSASGGNGAASPQPTTMAQAAATPAPVAAPAGGAAPMTAVAAKPAPRLPPAVWAVGLALLVAILLYVVTRGGGH
jgi:hypothetical protein